jgi:hypothetical protein
MFESVQVAHVLLVGLGILLTWQIASRKRVATIKTQARLEPGLTVSSKGVDGTATMLVIAATNVGTDPVAVLGCTLKLRGVSLRVFLNKYDGGPMPLLALVRTGWGRGREGSPQWTPIAIKPAETSEFAVPLLVLKDALSPYAKGALPPHLGDGSFLPFDLRLPWRRGIVLRPEIWEAAGRMHRGRRTEIQTQDLEWDKLSQEVEPASNAANMPAAGSPSRRKTRKRRRKKVR